MRNIGWKGDSLRHSLAARGYKTKVSRLYSDAYSKWSRRNARVVDDLEHHQADVYRSLGVRYRDEIRRAPWFKRPLTSGAVMVVPSSDYDNLEPEQSLHSHGEMSYAMTTLSSDGVREKVIIRDSGSKRLNEKLLRHELEEYKIYRKLLGAGVRDVVARPLAHELTFTKVTNAEVDRAYGDIGDPT